MSRRAAIRNGHPCYYCDVSAEALCRVLTVHELARFRDRGATVRLESGKALFHEGDPADAVFSLTSGSLKLYGLLPDGRRQLTGFVFPGDFIGVADGEEHHCTAEAMSPATLCRFPKAQFERDLQIRPILLSALYRRAVSDLAALESQVILLGRKTALERLASFLRNIHRRTRDGPSHAAMRFHLPMKRTDIADYLGITKETVCRRLTQLKVAGIIRIRSANSLEILDLKRLDDIARGRGC